MPNWCWNNVSFSGSPADRSRFRELMGANRGAFDFNAVAPMPEGLELCNHSDETAYTLKYGDWKNDPWWGSQFDTREAVLQAARHPENAGRWRGFVCDPLSGEPRTIPRTFDECADMAYANVLAHGHAYWYHWCCEHWGTKWLADVAHWSTAGDRETVCFDTAWSPPVPVLERLALLYPDAEIELEYDSVESAFRGRAAFACGALVEKAHEEYDPYAESEAAT